MTPRLIVLRLGGSAGLDVQSAVHEASGRMRSGCRSLSSPARRRSVRCACRSRAWLARSSRLSALYGSSPGFGVELRRGERGQRRYGSICGYGARGRYRASVRPFLPPTPGVFCSTRLWSGVDQVFSAFTIFVCGQTGVILTLRVGLAASAHPSLDFGVDTPSVDIAIAVRAVLSASVTSFFCESRIVCCALVWAPRSR